jgi:TRAP-type C4-dicarboxylate transport system permease small subunit
MPDMVGTFIRWVDRALLTLAAVALLAMMLHISADIAASLLWNAPFGTTSAIVTQYYMIAVAYLPVLAAERRGAHISISLVTDLLPVGVQRAVRLLVMLLTTFVYAMLTWQGWDQAADKLAIGAYMTEQTSRIVVWPSFFLIPAGFGAMALLMLAKTLLLLAGRDPAAANGLAAGGRDV